MKEYWAIRRTSARGSIPIRFSYFGGMKNWIAGVVNGSNYSSNAWQLMVEEAYLASSKNLNLLNKSDCDFEDFLKQYKPTKRQKTVKL